MTKTAHFGSNRNFSLSKAILLYSDGRECFATVHEPKDSPDGGAPYLDSGEPVTIDFLKLLAKGLGRSVPREILPQNVLVRTPDMLVWWTKAQRRVMFYADSSDGRTLNGKVYPQPALVFKVCGSELSVRALAEDRRPKADTPLMVAPYWNCDRQGGRVCQGSMRVPGKLSPAAMKDWEKAFFESEFTHAALGAQLTSDPEGFLGLWRDLAGSQMEFPAKFLIKSRESLQSFVQAEEG
jgi:PRTRC genetic system protein B